MAKNNSGKCLIKQKEDGSFIQICTCKNGSAYCKTNK